MAKTQPLYESRLHVKPRNDRYQYVLIATPRENASVSLYNCAIANPTCAELLILRIGSSKNAVSTLLSKGIAIHGQQGALLGLIFRITVSSADLLSACKGKDAS